MRILVIDDNPDDRVLMIHEINALFPQAQVIELTDLGGLHAALASSTPHLVLTDLDLRWTNGREVLMMVKGRYPTCPVIMFTGTGDETVAVELMKAGLDDYVVKSPRQLPRLRISLKLAVEMAASRVALSDREALLSRALAQQQVVVRELHHRVKNNLQTISGLLYMRARAVDPTTGVHLKEIAGRMEALAAVQLRIYDSMNFDRVDFRETLIDIASSMVKIYNEGQTTLFMKGVASFDLDVARAMPLSLVCYEVILNAMKYAWPGGEPGTLTINIVEVGDMREITIADNGVGLVDEPTARGMGSSLTISLAEEAGAVFERVSSLGSGTCVSLKLR